MEREKIFKKIEKERKNLESLLSEDKKDIKEIKKETEECLDVIEELDECIPADMCFDYFYVYWLKEKLGRLSGDFTDRNDVLRIAYSTVSYCYRLTYENFLMELDCMSLTLKDLEAFDKENSNE